MIGVAVSVAARLDVDGYLGYLGQLIQDPLLDQLGDIVAGSNGNIRVHLNMGVGKNPGTGGTHPNVVHKQNARRLSDLPVGCPAYRG